MSKSSKVVGFRQGADGAALVPRAPKGEMGFRTRISKLERSVVTLARIFDGYKNYTDERILELEIGAHLAREEEERFAAAVKAATILNAARLANAEANYEAELAQQAARWWPFRRQVVRRTVVREQVERRPITDEIRAEHRERFNAGCEAAYAIAVGLQNLGQGEADARFGRTLAAVLLATRPAAAAMPDAPAADAIPEEHEAQAE